MKKTIDIEERVAKGVELFKRGYNCSQAVVAAFADVYDVDEHLALKLSASFGGGTGRMRMTCGAANAMFLLAGLENGSIDPSDMKARTANYQLVQQLAEKFKETNGSLVCAELLNFRTGKVDIPIPSERTKEYYATRPCSKMVESACLILGNYLKEKDNK